MEYVCIARDIDRISQYNAYSAVISIAVKIGISLSRP